ncbi:MAG: UDP-N-acetylmuramate:L-alanyl-gamma-D-glutamyl-meso-diaminopimelate ligase [Gammaproteobacteria bacterium]|nr:UDP-N-acetylmuramate:L-alanyl-gamma-D-glutamyl-meso-diaminopimelate ligase [Gammaproteobacteria bacterium]
MHIHILGICGTFMGGIALLARELGFTVTGSDTNVYPPMSTQLREQGITLTEGYDPSQLLPHPDLIVIGNTMSRGNPAIEYVLNNNLRYASGPAFLAEHIIHNRWVLAVAGTHGKTTTTSILAWILEYAGLKPGFLVGGVPENFGVSARLGNTPFFVVEADEYDTAFFDKRSKFVHYRPRTLIINNIEFDHADIFPDVPAIQRQFHHLVRTVPGNGMIIAPQHDIYVQQTLKMGCWTPVEGVGAEGLWRAQLQQPDGSVFEVLNNGKAVGVVHWPLIGDHNVHNGLVAIAAAQHAGVPAATAIAALKEFHNVKRRMENRGTVNDVTVYDDFAHHPTAIETTLGGLRKHVGKARILAILEPRSNTMRMGVHKDLLAASLAQADRVILYAPRDLGWDVGSVIATLGAKGQAFDDIQAIIKHVVALSRPGDQVLIMSNGGFGGIHEKLLNALRGS